MFFNVTSDLSGFNEASLENLSQQLTAAGCSTFGPGIFCKKCVKRTVNARTWVEDVLLLSSALAYYNTVDIFQAEREELTTDGKSWTILLFDFLSHLEAGLKQALHRFPTTGITMDCTRSIYLKLQEAKKLQHQLQPST